MSAVLGIVRGHHGVLDVSSVLNEGTTFRLLLPLPEASLGDEKKQKALQSIDKERNSMSGTVLVVDDEDVIREVAQDMIESMGFNVLQASDGLQALEMYQEHGKIISVVLLDLTMPKMDGKACFYALKGDDANVKVLISSGYHESEIREKFVGEELVGFVQKPYTYEKLEHALHMALASN